MPANAWYMVTTTCGASGYAVYLNDTVVASGAYQNGQTSAMFMTGADSIRLGANYNQTTMNGLIDDFNLFTTA